jgi:hypothetical protein
MVQVVTYLLQVFAPAQQSNRPAERFFSPSWDLEIGDRLLS